MYVSSPTKGGAAKLQRARPKVVHQILGNFEVIVKKKGSSTSSDF